MGACEEEGRRALKSGSGRGGVRGGAEVRGRQHVNCSACI